MGSEMCIRDSEHVGLVLQLLQEYTSGTIGDASTRLGELRSKPDVIANRLLQPLITLHSNPFSNRRRSNPSWLRSNDVARSTFATVDLILQNQLWHLGCLAATSGTDNNTVWVCCHHFENLITILRHR